MDNEHTYKSFVEFGDKPPLFCTFEVEVKVEGDYAHIYVDGKYQSTLNIPALMEQARSEMNNEHPTIDQVRAAIKAEYVYVDDDTDDCAEIIRAIKEAKATQTQDDYDNAVAEAVDDLE